MDNEAGTDPNFQITTSNPTPVGLIPSKTSTEATSMETVESPLETTSTEASSTPEVISTTLPDSVDFQENSASLETGVPSNLHPLDKEKLKELSVKGHAATEAMIQAKREKIMALFDSPHHKTFYRTGLTNREVEIALRVSHATVARYLHDLVLAGRLKKVGAGRFLRYVRVS